jgi:hypothetical protein
MDQALTTQIFSTSPAPIDPVVRRFVNATEFCDLMVSHRRMERVRSLEKSLRGLRDLDTGEVFLTDERRLLALPR